MRAVACALVLAGCNWVYGLDTTRVVDGAPPADPAVDEDLDGVLNEVDNCPGVPNPDQTDLGGPDAPGDACDPDFLTSDTMIAAYYFNDASDATHFTLDPAFRVATGFIEIDRVAEITYAYGKDMPAITRGTMTVEAGFELVELTTDTRVGVYTDGATAHYSWLELRPEPFLVIINTVPAPDVCMDTALMGCDEESIVALPPRIVVQQTSGNAKRDGIRAMLAGTDIDATYNATEAFVNTFGVLAQNARARLHHVIVYSGQ